ncbi:MMPL family transporter [Desulfuromonas acetoxidans]|uniref:Exporter-like n=1 Tax=Desulfuromonas acetoxidans (strain DSM 684 / 11070) TaxID=281689 RepID=Q1K0Q4_DESA6|nr:MMPL family transporter [Desulfuromonas acetoxidans]EAT15887.1 exporter-like [Desulfuromonas acetoxidans DSM 684]MBF0646859.1 MMPL family transporter [Desulfuromonas acetoxidans]NVD24487.1 MMPL family transporter [Desulfuromonas acetoxidans]NVE16564.1 MMPL family transporter [Desulfuromonas acetoxidans]
MISVLFNYFQGHRRLLFVVYGLFVVVSFALLMRLTPQETIDAMLPDATGSTVRDDFTWLQRAPFARKVFIDLEVSDPQQQAILKAGGKALAVALEERLQTTVTDGPPIQQQATLLSHLSEALPRLVTEEDLQVIAKRLADDAIMTERLVQIKSQLMTPQGWWTKGQLQRDPLQLWQLSADHLRDLNPFAGAGGEHGAFVSRDGRHRLLMVDTTVEIGDVTASRRLLSEIDTAILETLPPEVTATVVSGHRYTVANADTVQRDIRVVFSVASVAILLIFMVLLRNVRALWVFFLPASVLGIAAFMVTVWFPQLSGITLGFGAVLLGITVDFTLHVFFALRSGGAPLGALQRLTRPLVGSALTSFMAFSVLLYSTLPGQRQLAVFSMTAIAAALLLALVVMPHLCGIASGAMARSRHEAVRHHPRAAWIWLVVVMVAAFGCSRLTFDGDLRRLSVQTAALSHGEALMKQVWGDVRSRTLIFSQGNTEHDALAVNARVAELIASQQSSASLVSLATLLPTEQHQQQSLFRWQDFWQQHQPQWQRFFELAQQQGFSATAFESFDTALSQPSPLLNLPFWQQAGLGTVIEGLLVTDLPQGTAVVSLLDTGKAGEERALELDSRLEQIPGVVVVDQSQFRQQLSAQVGHDFITFILRAMAVVVVVLAVWYRRLSRMVLALLPVLGGLVVMFGVMGWLGLAFNLFNVIAAILIIGLGVDYGIFMVNRCQYGSGMHTDKAVLVSALTTLAGFGSLALARHPAMSSMGLTVLFGISAAVLTALLVVPTVYAHWCSTSPKGGSS